MAGTAPTDLHAQLAGEQAPRRITGIMETHLLGPQTHRLPFRVMWGINLFTAVSVAFLNFFMVLSIEQLVHFKFWSMDAGFRNGSIGLGIFVLMVVSTCYATVMVCLIQFIAPNCGGSGIPENKTYINGGSMPGFFTKRTLVVRVATNVLANAAGFPVGREGPMVTIGSNVAFKISKFLAKPYVKEWYEFQVRERFSTRALLLDEQRLAHTTRIACTVGGACAMTVIFNAPFGGLLYMFEEVTSVAWPLELTFRVFVSTMLSSLLSYGLCDISGSRMEEFVIYAKGPQTKKWLLTDLPVFILVAVLMGVFTSLHTRGMLAMARVRQSTAEKLKRWQPTPKIVETAIYAAVCAFASAGVSLLGPCEKQGKSGFQYVVFNCGEGEYNPIASLLVATSHSAVKLLFSGGNAGEIRWTSSFLAFLTYSLLNVCLGGLPVPGGAFTATMLMGAMFGRSVGSLMSQLGYPFAVSGVYAVVGSAAMLCGFKQMTLASVLIVIECVNDLSLAPIVMLGVGISMAINWTLNERGHDEAVIIRRKLPFLEGEAPRELDHVLAVDLCHHVSDAPGPRGRAGPRGLGPLPPEAILEPKASVDAVQAALAAKVRVGAIEECVCYFPIRDRGEGPCLGIITRPHLEGVLQAAVPHGGRRTGQEAFPDTEMQSPRGSVFPRSPNGASGLPLDEVMDPTPFAIGEDTPAPRLYAMFAKGGERAACVTSRTGEFRGIISREGLIAACRPPDDV